MGLEFSNLASFIETFNATGNTYELIISIVKTLPLSTFVLVLILITMIAFYATSFDSIALTASCYSYHKLKDNEQPHKLIQLMWCILLIVLPIGLVFAESSMSNLQSVSIIAAFPIGIIMILIIFSFFREVKKIFKKNY